MSTSKQLDKIVKKYKDEKPEQRKYDPSKQIEGYKKRIEGSGIDLEKATDKRGPIEKLFNLPEEQNPLFDLFEIINRPQQAIFGGIKENQEGGDFFEGAKAGFTGNERTQFKEILHNAGMEETEGKLGFDDVLGFAGDVFLDPADLALFPLSKSAKLAKASKIAASKEALRVASVGYDAAVALKQADGISAALKTSVQAKEAYMKALKGRKTRSLTEVTIQGLGQGVKSTVKFSDKVVSNSLKFIDKTHADHLNILGRQQQQVTSLMHYTNVKDMITNTFNAAKNMPKGLLTLARKARGTEKFAKKQMYTTLDSGNIDKIVQQIVDSGKYTKEEANTLAMTVFEHADQLLSPDGKLHLSGLRHKTSTASIIDDSAHMTQQGLLKKDAEELEEFVKMFMPDWYADHVTEQAPMFRQYEDKTGVVQDVYRINNEQMHNSLKQRLSTIRDNQELPALKASKIEPEVATEINKLDNEANVYRVSKENGHTKIIPENTPQKKAVLDRTAAFKKLEAKNGRIAKKIDKIRKQFAEGTITQADRSAKLKALKLEAKEITKVLETESAAIKLMVDRFSQDIDQVIDANKLAKETLYKTNNIHGEYLGKDIMDIANVPKEVSMYFSDAQKAKLESFAKEEFVEELIGEIDLFMTQAAQIMMETMESSFKLTGGYMSHAITPDWANMRLDKYSNKASKESWASTKGIIGSTSAFASRRYKTSAMEANALSKSYIDYLIDTGKVSGDAAKELLDSKVMNMFSTDIKTSFIDFIEKAPKAVADGQMLSYVLGKSLIDDKSGNIIVGDSSSNTANIKVRERGKMAPRGYTRFTSDALDAKLKQMTAYLNQDGSNEMLVKLNKEATAWLKSNAGNELYINNNINAMIGRLTDPVEASSFLKVMDWTTNMFKKNKLLSPGFQMRNVVGNISNMWLSGMSIPEIFKYNREAGRILKHGDELFEIQQKGTRALTKVEADMLAEYSEFVKMGFADLGNALHDIPEHLWSNEARVNAWKAYKKKQKTAAAAGSKLKPTAGEMLAFPKEKYDALAAWNMKINQQQDALFRMSMYRYAKNNPDFLTKFDYSDPADAVRKVLFDFQDLSTTEQDVMRKLIPFYTFTKKNLGFQIANMQKNSVKYNRMIKSFNNMWDVLDLDDDEMDKFKMENFWIPIPFIDKDGKYKAIKSSLPLGDLGEFLDTPLRRVLASTAPVVRAPFEMAMNKQVFSDMPIQEFKGQKGFYIPELSKKAEFGLSQVGLDVPVAFGADVGRTAVNLAKGDIKNPLDAFEGSMGRTIMSTGDPERTQSRNAYNELDDLENLMRYYKQEGVEIKTLAELENSSLFKGRDAMLAKLRQIRGK